ncbi:MAG: hypothetical protein GWO07_03665, partial [Candidatus Dadabacteria bacterium]|nr:hypothetical protein [Candidatus Dadabacteria bacterium]NIS07862.1 hypothetical protein [Candidatus Dadabacteria bacterium]NIY21650.1 hypothetical protein [Candidatus Dadabacteria bacterium]
MFKMLSRSTEIALIILTFQIIYSAGIYAQTCTQEQINELRNAGVSQEVISNVCPSVSKDSAIGSVGADQLIELAASGNAEAAYQLGQMYEEGEGVLKDYVKSYAWYSKAYSNSGSQIHKSALDSIESKMTPGDIEKGQELAKQTNPSDPLD